MVKTSNISFTYKNGASITFPDMEMAPGSEWLILGPSGCGKTTLLHLLSGLLHPDSGEIIIGDTDITALPSSKLDKYRGRHIGLVFQEAHFLSSISVLENLMLAQKLAGLKPDRAICMKLLESLGLNHRAKAKPYQLSVGEKQRASIGRAVINSPKVLLADEPTSALDDYNTAEVLKLLREQASAHNATLIIVTHDARLKDVISKSIELA